MLSTKLLVPILTMFLPSFVSAIPLLEDRAGGVCNSGIYGELAPLLVGYSPAQAYCTQKYPVACTTAKAKVRRATTTSGKTSTVKTTPKVTTTTPVKTSTTSKTTSSDPKASAWSKLQQQVAGIVSTLCSCIESPTVSKRKLPSERLLTVF